MMTIELPLFPLNTVLFPGMPITLHVFEERYKLLVGQCIEARRPFGVVLIERGVEAFGEAVPHRVGCTAKITHVQKLSGGRMNIIARGRDRFRILEIDDAAEPYLVGHVEPSPLENGEPEALAVNGRQLRPWVERYLAVLADATDVSLEAEELPQRPLPLAYLAAYLLQVSPQEKQALLALDDAPSLLSTVAGIYRRELPLVKHMATDEAHAQHGPFSLN